MQGTENVMDQGNLSLAVKRSLSDRGNNDEFRALNLKQLASTSRLVRMYLRRGGRVECFHATLVRGNSNRVSDGVWHFDRETDVARKKVTVLPGHRQTRVGDYLWIGPVPGRWLG